MIYKIPMCSAYSSGAWRTASMWVKLAAFLTLAAGQPAPPAVPNFALTTDDCSPKTIVGGYGDKLDLEECGVWRGDVNGQRRSVQVYWTDENGDVDDRPTGGSAAVAEIAQATFVGWQSLRDMGLEDPFPGAETISVETSDLGGPYGRCCRLSPDGFGLTVSLIGDMFLNIEVTTHELFHELRYGGDQWMTEGLATWSMDHVNDFSDNDPLSYFMKWTRVLLYNWRSYSVFDPKSAYGACLFWKFVSEQLGTNTQDSDTLLDGVDFLGDYFGTDRRIPGGEALSRLESLVQDKDRASSIQPFFRDFAIANYATQFVDDSGCPEYCYRDQNGLTSGSYPDVRIEQGGFVLNSDGFGSDGSIISYSLSIKPWTARYFKFSGLINLSSAKILTVLNEGDSPVPVTFFRTTSVLSPIVGETFDKASIRRRSASPDASFTLSNTFDNGVLIVQAFAKSISFKVTVNPDIATSRVLNILQLPGEIDVLEAPAKRVLLVFEILELSELSATTDLDPDDFRVELDGTLLNIVGTPSVIDDQYWLLIEIPGQNTDGVVVHDVDVIYMPDDTSTGMALNATTQLKATYCDTMCGNLSPAFDQFLLLDGSGSMKGAKLQAAKEASTVYVDLTQGGDKIGLDVFSGSLGSIKVKLAARSATLRQTIIDEIEDTTASGCTPLYDALVRALSEMANRAASTKQEIVVLSDGRNTCGTAVEKDFSDAYDDISGGCTAGGDLSGCRPKIHTIAIGADAERADLQFLSESTGGTFNVVLITDPATRRLRRLEADPSAIAMDLAAAYVAVDRAVTSRVQVFEEVGTELPTTETSATEFTIVVDGAATEAEFVFAWSPRDKDARSVLYRPDGVQAPDPFEDSGRRIWKIASPQSGEWTMKAWKDGGPIIILRRLQETDAVDHLVEAAVTSELILQASLPRGKAVRGRPISIRALLFEDMPLAGQTVVATVTSPNGVETVVPLRDNGQRRDGDPNDGIYAGLFPFTAISGNYLVVVSASGTSAFSGNFRRRARLAFAVEAGPDSDGDGLPDLFEEATGTDPTVPDCDEDPDLDGLTNCREFELGTDPLNADSDGGGETDGSEVAAGQNPLDSSDDTLPCLLDFQAYNNYALNVEGVSESSCVSPRASVLWYSYEPSIHEAFQAWRAPTASGPWTQLESNLQEGPPYVDADVVLGTTYYYKMAPLAADGSVGCISGPVSATPVEEILCLTEFSSNGGIVINGGAATAESVDNSLTFAAQGARRMRIANGSPLPLEDLPWEEFLAEQSWTLIPENGIAEVFAELEGDVPGDTFIVSDDIRMVPTCSKASSSIETLWPPNHKLIGPIDVVDVVDYTGESAEVTILSIYQDEAPLEAGSGHTPVDAEGVGSSSFFVRAERSGQGDGRMYTVAFEAVDQFGGACTGSIQVCVPKKKGDSCVDQGSL